MGKVRNDVFRAHPKIEEKPKIGAPRIFGQVLSRKISFSEKGVFK
jgi:hypothetical protein